MSPYLVSSVNTPLRDGNDAERTSITSVPRCSAHVSLAWGMTAPPPNRKITIDGNAVILIEAGL